MQKAVAEDNLQRLFFYSWLRKSFPLLDYWIYKRNAQSVNYRLFINPIVSSTF